MKRLVCTCTNVIISSFKLQFTSGWKCWRMSMSAVDFNEVKAAASNKWSQSSREKKCSSLNSHKRLPPKTWQCHRHQIRSEQWSQHRSILNLFFLKWPPGADCWGCKKTYYCTSIWEEAPPFPWFRFHFFQTRLISSKCLRTSQTPSSMQTILTGFLVQHPVCKWFHPMTASSFQELLRNWWIHVFSCGCQIVGALCKWMISC